MMKKFILTTLREHLRGKQAAAAEMTKWEAQKHRMREKLSCQTKEEVK
jgi:anti-sigma factor RsiW